MARAIIERQVGIKAKRWSEERDGRIFLAKDIACAKPPQGKKAKYGGFYDQLSVKLVLQTLIIL